MTDISVKPPATLDDMILAEDKRRKLKKIMQEISNTLLYGIPGTGKSTFMRILLSNQNIYSITINASSDNGIDIIRDKIEPFSSKMPISNTIKVVYFEEADKLTEEAQNALKYTIDKFNHITKYFFVCNEKKGFIDPILSRCSYKIELEDPPKTDIYNHLSNILQKNNIEYDKSAIYYIIKTNYPDIRSMLNELISNIVSGKLEANIRANDVSKSQTSLKSAEQRRATDRQRVQRWHERQKKAGKKQISCVISEEAYNRLQTMEGSSYAEKIEKLILSHSEDEQQD